MKVSRHTNGNVGGLNPIQFIFKEDIAAFNFSKSTMTGSITLKGGASWNYLYATPDTIQLESKEDMTDAGMKYTYQFKMLIPKDRPEVEVLLNSLNNRHIIINAIDKNGVSRFFGTPEEPMKKFSKILKPPTIEGFNGWELIFVGEFQTPAFYSNSPAGPINPTD